LTQITTILSDIGNVVVFFENWRTVNRLTSLAPWRGAGRDVNTKRINRIFFDRNGMWNLFDRGFIHQKDIIPTILTAIGLTDHDVGMKAEKAKAAWVDVFTHNKPIVEDWKKLRASGLTFTAVSNIDALRYGKMVYMGVMGFFDHEVLSFEEGMLKQDGPQIFIRALDRSGCKAEDAFFVDDREDCIAEAKKLGIRTHLYDHRDHKALEKRLMSLGVPILSR